MDMNAVIEVDVTYAERHGVDSRLREGICVESQGFSGGWDGGLSYAPAASHPSGGRAPALHFSVCKNGGRFAVRQNEDGHRCSRR